MAGALLLQDIRQRMDDEFKSMHTFPTCLKSHAREKMEAFMAEYMSNVKTMDEIREEYAHRFDESIDWSFFLRTKLIPVFLDMPYVILEMCKS